MATYLQGVTDFIPQVQPWAPDYNFYQSALDRKQQKYDMGWKQTNTMYNSLLNAPMMREDNIATRDGFFKNIEENINRLSGIDLSLQQNVDAASQLFTPLVENKNVLNDMGWTKKFQREQQTAETYRNCLDPKKCGGKYWDEGVRALKYMAEDFRSVTADQAMQMQAPRYVPYNNAVDKAFDKLKDQKFGGETISWSPDGKYVVKEVNGTQIIEPVTSYLASTLGNDPAVTDMYKTKAYVQRKDWLSANGQNYGSAEEAEAAYFEMMVQPSVNTVEEVSKEVTETRKDREVEVSAFEKTIGLEGIIPGSEEHKAYKTTLSEFDKLIGLEADMDNQLSVAKNITKSTNANAMRINSDAAVASAMFFDDMVNTAMTYQQLTHEIDMKADEYALADYKHQQAKDLYIWKEGKKAEALAKNIGDFRQNDTAMEEDKQGVGTEGSEDVLAVMADNIVKIKTDNNYQVAKREGLAEALNSFIAVDESNSVSKEHDLAKIFQDYASDLVQNYGKSGLFGGGNRRGFNDGKALVGALRNNNQTNFVSDDFKQFSDAEIDDMWKKMDATLKPGIKKYNKETYNRLSQSRVEGQPSIMETVDQTDALIERYKGARINRWNGDPTSKNPDERIGLKDGWENMAMTGNHNIFPGYNGYKSTLGGDSKLNNDTAKEAYTEMVLSLTNPDGTPKSFEKWSKPLLIKGQKEGWFVSYEFDGKLKRSDLQDKTPATDEEALVGLASVYYGKKDNPYIPESKATDFSGRGIAGGLTSSLGLSIGSMVSAFTGGSGNVKVKGKGKSKGIGKDISEVLDVGLIDAHNMFWRNNPNVKLINGINGGGAGGFATKKQAQYGIDPATPASSNFQDARSLVVDIYRNLGDARFYQVGGDEDENGRDDRVGKQLFEAYTQYAFIEDWTPKGEGRPSKDRPRTGIKYLGDYKGRGKEVKAQIIFDRKWVEDNAGTEKSPGLTRNSDGEIMYNLAENGMVLMLPKQGRDNNYEKRTKTNWDELALRAGQGLKFETKYPTTGNVTLRYNNTQNGYEWQGNMRYFDSDVGQYTSYPLPISYNQYINHNPDMMGRDLFNVVEPTMQALEEENLRAEAAYKTKHGIKDKSKL